MGLSSPKTTGLISKPMRLAGKGARLALMTPVAICKPDVQCANISTGVMLPHKGSLSA